MTERIEYLFDLGVTCLWLMPFYPTARRDDGYDITDFFGVDPRLGTHGDFVELVRTAKSTGIRVIIDFVMNHTSDAHPWFKSARRSIDDPYRDYYVWSATKPKSSNKDVVFPDEEDSLWELDTRTDEWYLHHFLKTQPDLNIANTEVQEEISRTLGFWLELGVSGFRVDAVPVPVRQGWRAGRSGSVRPQPIPRRHPQFRHPPARRRRAARRGQPSLQRSADVLRRPRRRRAEHAIRLHRDAEHVPLARPWRRRPDRQRPAGSDRHST